MKARLNRDTSMQEFELERDRKINEDILKTKSDIYQSIKTSSMKNTF